MKKIKLIFQQALMISSGMLFLVGVKSMIRYFADGEGDIIWQWYMPLAIVLTGFITALPSVLLLDAEGTGKQSGAVWRIAMHFLIVLAIVSGEGYVFGWYKTVLEYVIILIMFVMIYAFVWLASFWITKTDEHRINEALKEIRDEE